MRAGCSIHGLRALNHTPHVLGGLNLRWGATAVRPRPLAAPAQPVQGVDGVVGAIDDGLAASNPLTHPSAQPSPARPLPRQRRQGEELGQHLQK
eukprot:32828-Pyramimonas_sp.AAC.1